MSGLRRLFRGSGRALAFVFAASVAWVLLDMAALRLSLGEAGGRLLREAAGRGQGPGPGPGQGRARPRRGPEVPPGTVRSDPSGPRRREPPPSPPPAAPAGRSAGAARPGAPAMAPAPAAPEPPAEAAGQAAAAPAGRGAGERGAAPAPRQPPGPGHSEPPRPAGVGGTGIGALRHATNGSEQRPPGTAGHTGPAARAAGAQPEPEETNRGQKAAASKTRFIVISKERMNLASPAAPRRGPHSAGNVTARYERHKELSNKNSDGAHPATAAAGTTTLGGRSQELSATPGAAGTGQNGQEHAGATPGAAGAGQDGEEHTGAAPRAAGAGQNGQEHTGAAPRAGDTSQGGQEHAGTSLRVVGTGQDRQEHTGAAPRAGDTGQGGQEHTGASPRVGDTGQGGQEHTEAAPRAGDTGQGGQKHTGAAPRAGDTGQGGQEHTEAAPRVADSNQDGQDHAGASLRVVGTGQDRQEQVAGSPGMHKVLSVDATLAPRDPRAPGQFGHPVAVPDDKQEEAKSRWKEGNFNVYLSDMIPVDRAIADTRPAGCSEQRVHNDLPTTTIIMCFVDEVWSTLLRSVHSVLSRSPPHLIEEVILVDDFSTKEYLKEQLDTYMARFPKVKILRLKERHGLIRARLAGAEIARGTVLTFLDSHVECNVGWLEPLLERVRLRRTKVACPVIEVISDKDMSYMTVDNFQRGIFTWPMNFGWRQIPQEVIEKNKIKETDIIRCPVMAGGLFSIDKKYFFELGMYDPGLDVWGGENMEISFKVWMCGGEIEIVPCSRVGHIFRNDNPYSFPKDRVRTVERNLARVAEVWLDEYKELFYGHAYHLVLKNVDVGDLTQQIQLRKKLQCKSFRWYLENVYPDLEAPLVKASGLLVNVALAGCIAVEGTTLAFEECDVNNTNQKFNYTWLRLIQHGELCLAPSGVVGAVGLRRCQGRSRSLAWLHRSLATVQPGLTDHIISEHQHLPQPSCLEVDPSYKALRVKACDSINPYQKWQFGSYHAD